MTARSDVVWAALAEDGYHDGQGYDERCKYSQSFLGPSYGAYGEGGTGPNDTPVLAYCGIFVSWVYEKVGLPLPKMGSWIRSGSQYCPQIWGYAASRGAVLNSYLASPGDLIIFQWDGKQGFDGSDSDGDSHVELVVRNSGGVLYTIGGNSGGSNVNGYRGTGGVHQHAWSCPQGVGNPLMVGAVNTGKLVGFSDPNPTPPRPGGTVDWLGKIPSIDPGRDVGHPGTVYLLDGLLRLENPKIDLSTPAKKSHAIEQVQAVMFNAWQMPPHGPNPHAVTGRANPETIGALNYAIAMRQS